MIATPTKLQFIATNIFILITFAIIYVSLPSKSFNVDRQLTFMDALYFATTTHTTLGFGDIHPVSTSGRLFTMAHGLLIFISLAIFA